MAHDVSAYYGFISAIHSPGAPPRVATYFPNDMVSLHATSTGLSGQETEVVVTELVPTARNPERFAISVAGSAAIPVGGTGDVAAWHSTGSALPPSLGQHRGLVVPAIRAASEAARLLAAVRSRHNKSPEPAPVPRAGRTSKVWDLIFGAPKPPSKAEVTREQLKRRPPSAVAGDAAVEKLTVVLTTNP